MSKIRIKFTKDQEELLMLGDRMSGEKGYYFWKLNNVWYKPIGGSKEFSGEEEWEAMNEIDLIQYALNHWTDTTGSEEVTITFKSSRHE